MNVMGEECREDSDCGSSIACIVVSRVAGFLLFLVVLAAASWLSTASGNLAAIQITAFFIASLPVLIAMSAVFLAGEIFAAMMFPFSLPGPVFSAAGALLFVHFLFGLFTGLAPLLGPGFPTVPPWLAACAYIAAFTLVLLCGYASIFSKLFSRLHPKREEWRIGKEKEVEYRTKDAGKRGEAGDWNEVGEEFRGLVYDALRKARRDLKNGDGSAKKKEK